MQYKTNPTTNEVEIKLTEVEKISLEGNIMDRVVETLARVIIDEFKDKFIKDVLSDKKTLRDQLRIKVVEKSMNELEKKIK